MVTDPVLSFDPIRILQQLSADGVEFVLIGGIAGRVHGSPTVTNDLDICYRRTKVNFGRLANTLRELGARLRDFPPSLPSTIDARSIWQGDNFTFVTEADSSTVSLLPNKARRRAMTNWRRTLKP